MIKKIAVVLFFVCSIATKGQNQKLNNFKYIIVQDKFDFLKGSDQYQTSSLTKFLLKKSGFIVFLSNEKLPSDLNKDRCLTLFANVVDKSTMFTTKSVIELKDCKGNIVYKSEVGSSKLKEFKKSFHESIRRAYNSMESFKYSYTVKKDEIFKENNLTITKKVKKEVKLTDNTVIPITNKNTPKKEIFMLETLYAQSKENGFQLINTKPEVVFVILNTNINEVFVIKDKNGVLYKSEQNWVAEYYENNKLIQKKYQVKF